jgi:hypothetical protein
MTLVAATALDLAARDLATAHTVAFVTLRGDATLRVRYTGPTASGVATLPWDAPLVRVLGILRDAGGLATASLLDLATVAVFVPVPGSDASTVDEVHAEHNYTVFVRSAPR